MPKNFAESKEHYMRTLVARVSQVDDKAKSDGIASNAQRKKIPEFIK